MLRDDESAWVCAANYRTAVREYAERPILTRPALNQTTTLVKPKRTLERSGSTVTETRGFDRYDQGRVVFGDPTLYRQSSEHFLVDNFSSLPLLSNSEQTDLNGQRVGTCSEYGFQKVEDYANWADDLVTGRNAPGTTGNGRGAFTPMESVGHLFHTLRGIVEVNPGQPGQPPKLSYLGHDSEGHNIPQTFTTASPNPQTYHLFNPTGSHRSALELWDHTQQRLRSNPARVQHTWDWHYNAYMRARSTSGWPSDEVMEFLYEEQKNLAGLIGQYTRLEFEAIYLLLEDSVRRQSIAPKQAWAHANARAVTRGLSTNPRAMSCRFRTFERLLTDVNAFRANASFNPRSWQHLESPGPQSPSAQQMDALDVGNPRYYGTAVDPMDGYTGRPSRVQPRSEALGWDDFRAGPPADAECDVLTNPASPFDEVVPTRSNWSFAEEVFAWKMDRIRSAQTALVAQINEQHAMLRSRCTTIDHCEWAPQMLLDEVNLHFGRIQQHAEARCKAVIEGNFDQTATLSNRARLNALFALTNPEAIVLYPAARRQQILNWGDAAVTDWGSSPTQLEAMFTAVEEFRTLTEEAAMRGHYRLGRIVYQGLGKSKTSNRAVLAELEEFRSSLSDNGYDQSNRTEAVTGVLCPSPNETGDLLYRATRDCEPVASRTSQVRARPMNNEPAMRSFMTVMQNSAVATSPDVPTLNGTSIGVIPSPTQYPGYIHAKNATTFSNSMPIAALPIGPVHVKVSIQAGISFAFESTSKAQPVVSTLTGRAAYDIYHELVASTDIALTVGVGIAVVEVGLKSAIEPFAVRLGLKQKAVAGKVKSDTVVCSLRDAAGQCQSAGNVGTELASRFGNETMPEQLGCLVNLSPKYLAGDSIAVWTDTCPLMASRDVAGQPDDLYRLQYKNEASVRVTMFALKLKVYIKIAILSFEWVLLKHEPSSGVTVTNSNRDQIMAGRTACDELVDEFGGIDKSACLPRRTAATRE